MRIAIISTCAVATPPKAYGGTELFVADLARALGQLGHDVTVFATGDSTPEARLRFHFPQPMWPPQELFELRHVAFAWNDIAEDPYGFDVVHVNHAAAFALNHIRPQPCVATLHHDRVAALAEYYRGFDGVTCVAISHRQAELIPEARARAVVHHGLDPDRYPAGAGRGDYCAFLGRFAPEKAPHLAIDAARAAGVRIRLGGVPHEVALDYFQREIEPRLRDRERVEWCGELSHEPKVRLLGDARALLVPLSWEEPFGLVMIEAMLVGTPVVAFRRGSAPEIVEEGATGFLVDSVDEMQRRLREIERIDRRACRRRARERWSALRMARDYVAVYQRAIRAHDDGGAVRLRIDPRFDGRRAPGRAAGSFQPRR